MRPVSVEGPVLFRAKVRGLLPPPEESKMSVCGLSSFAYGTGATFAFQSGDMNRPIALLQSRASK
jgi:hypothetical protein